MEETAAPVLVGRDVLTTKAVSRLQVLVFASHFFYFDPMFSLFSGLFECEMALDLKWPAYRQTSLAACVYGRKHECYQSESSPFHFHVGALWKQAQLLSINNEKKDEEKLSTCNNGLPCGDVDAESEAGASWAELQGHAFILKFTVFHLWLHLSMLDESWLGHGQ